MSDTSPLRCLHHLRLLDVLQDLFGQVFVPPAVVEELRSVSRGDIALAITSLPFLTVRAPADAAVVARLAQRLDPGESEAIALAVEIHAEAILMDEQQGRQVAAEHGLQTMGVLGLLSRAKVAGLIPEGRPLLDRLRVELKFFVSDSLRARVLSDVGEGDGG